MTNQSGKRHENSYWLRGVSGKISGSVASTGGQAGSTTSARFCTLPAEPALQHASCHAAPRDSIRCCIHCSTSLCTSGCCAPSLMAAEMAFTDQLCKPFHRSRRRNWWCSSASIRGPSARSSNTLSPGLSCGQHGQNVLWDLWSLRMQGKMLNRASERSW